MADLDAVRTGLETFNEEIERETYENYSGQKDEIDTESIYARYSDIFENEALIDEVRARREATQHAERLRMQYLYGHLVGCYVGRVTTGLEDRMNGLQAKAEIEADGRKMPFRYAQVALANEPDHAKREAIDRARAPVIGQLNPMFLERLELSYRTAEGFDYADYISMCEDVKGFDLLALRDQMQNVLHRTDRLYTRHFRSICKDVLGLGLADVRKYDIGFLFRAPRLDRHFAPESMTAVLDATLDGMGLSLRERPNIRIDAEPREKKRPRAFCSGIRIPGEVVLCIRPQGGMDDYRALFHEMGHAQHFGNMPADLPFEFRYLGDTGLSETYAFLFEHLTGSPGWLARRFGLTDEEIAGVVQFTAFHTLYMVRRYAAKLLYELELHGGSPNPERLYAQYLGDALKLRHPEHEYLFDVDPGFYSADYLRAWMLEVQLRDALSEGFGTEWWNSPGAGRYLLSLWDSGQKLDCDRMARNLGYYGIEEYPLVKGFEKSLRY